ncbi:hypothetical protein [Mycolicibacterium moriokaense]|uniref:Cupin n=1 Tax=Mycolicibacterium moriokaense TaxID=39691 RepID=A0A318HVX4_9MYCO|nr:hypothetical protein [Mycolicibacterium moriokaense]PXX09241.1 hypothetical protein C8E89_106168 [Mycolicibacterium moriokaense]
MNAEYPRQNAEFFDFIDRGAAIVSECESDVFHLAKSDGLPPGFWHPTGFMTFEVMSVLGLGLVRLHCWLKGIRRERPNHADIHQHCFDLYSKVLCGRYLEDQYAIVEECAPSSQFSTYSVQPNYGKGYDDLVEMPLPGRIEIIANNVETQAGSAHWLPAGVFHATPIPQSEFCCTLVVMSLPRQGFQDVLIGRKGLDVSRSARVPVAASERKALAKALQGIST